MTPEKGKAFCKALNALTKEHGVTIRLCGNEGIFYFLLKDSQHGNDVCAGNEHHLSERGLYCSEPWGG